MKLFKTFLIFILFFSAAELSAFNLNLWRHPEIAEKNSVLCDVGFTLEFADFEFNFLPLYIKIDYMLPVLLPVSVGVFFITPDPNLKHFGLRVGYHFDINDPYTDIYLLYTFNFGFLRNDTLLEYNDTPVPLNFFDFRFGVRRFFGSFFGLGIETGFKLEFITISISIKIN